MALSIYQTTAILEAVLKKAGEIGECPMREIPSLLFDILSDAAQEKNVNLVGDTETYEEVYDHALDLVFKANARRKWKHAAAIV